MPFFVQPDQHRLKATTSLLSLENLQVSAVLSLHPLARLINFLHPVAVIAGITTEVEHLLALCRGPLHLARYRVISLKPTHNEAAIVCSVTPVFVCAFKAHLTRR